MRKLFSAAVLAAVLVAGVQAAPGQATSDPIQPGDRVISGTGSCTLNFVYDAVAPARDARAGEVYLGTAAHCVGKVGDVVRTESGEQFGRVAFIGDKGTTSRDYAFIEVLDGFHQRVSAAVKGFPSYPKGATVPTETSFGDTVQISGYGMVFGTTSLTRERRVAVLTYDDAKEHAVAGPLIFGDSGGPLVHVRTGKALGIVSRLCPGVCSEEGPTVQGILADAAARGFPVVLRTV